MEALIRFSIALGILLLMVTWEYLSPRRPLSQSRLQRWPVNLGLSALNMVIMRFSLAALAFESALYAQQQQWGLLNLFDIPMLFRFIITLLVLDFAIYLQHIASHKWAWFWRLHQVHHTDLDFDATTAVRFHPLEILLSMLYKALCIIALGAEPKAIIIFEIILNGCATFNHSNVFIPESWDKKLRYLIITPDMHRIHHSAIVTETDSNYGFSISLWDRLCRTYTASPQQPQTFMQIGLTGFRQVDDLKFLKLLIIPFQKLKNRF